MNKLINYDVTDLHRLQTGMRHAWGKPMGTAARVNIGTVLMSVRTKDDYKPHAIEAFRRTTFRFPGLFIISMHLILNLSANTNNTFI